MRSSDVKKWMCITCKTTQVISTKTRSFSYIKTSKPITTNNYLEIKSGFMLRNTQEHRVCFCENSEEQRSRTRACLLIAESVKSIVSVLCLYAVMLLTLATSLLPLTTKPGETIED